MMRQGAASKMRIRPPPTDAHCCSVDAICNGLLAGSIAAVEAALAAVVRKNRDSRPYASPNPDVRTKEAFTQAGSFLRHKKSAVGIAGAIPPTAIRTAGTAQGR